MIQTQVRKGLPLIELLVVVLIIGILATIALPQYRKAVWRSRVSEMQTMVSNLYKAQKIYFLTNGRYTDKISELDISFDSLPLKPTKSTCGFAVTSTDSVRANNLYELGISTNSDGGIYMEAFIISGQYKYGGFTMKLKGPQGRNSPDIHCQETPSMTPAGKFCQNLMNASYIGAVYGGWREYKLP